MRQVRIWLGIVGLVAAGYFAFDPAGRLELVWTKVLGGGPYVLGALAAVNLARSLRSTAAFLGPMLIALAAAVVLLRPSIHRDQVEGVAVLVILVVAAALILREYPETATWTRVLWTGRARAPARIGGRLRAVAVLGEIRVDLLASSVESRTTLTATTFGGRSCSTCRGSGESSYGRRPGSCSPCWSAGAGTRSSRASPTWRCGSTGWPARWSSTATDHFSGSWTYRDPLSVTRLGVGDSSVSMKKRDSLSLLSASCAGVRGSRRCSARSMSNRCRSYAAAR